jgi:peptide-methionine (S)-S-oxide reductase
MSIRSRLRLNQRLGAARESGALVLLAVPLAVAGAFMLMPARAETPPQRLPAPLLDVPATGGTQTAVLSGGCFWGVQGVFEHVRGVRKVLAGYSGGLALTADYDTVSTGTTGHAESVQITFDPTRVTYGQILRIFFSVALDPTDVGGQGPDRGSQYRSEVFYADAEQRNVATAYIAQLDQAHRFDRPIATRVDKLNHFYVAEDYHQDFLVRHPTQGYIAAFDIPKVESLRELFPEAYVAEPVLARKDGSNS